MAMAVNGCSRQVHQVASWGARRRSQRKLRHHWSRRRKVVWCQLLNQAQLPHLRKANREAPEASATNKYEFFGKLRTFVGHE